MIHFYTWKAAGINLAFAEGAVRAAESVRDKNRLINECLQLVQCPYEAQRDYMSANPVLYLDCIGDDCCVWLWDPLGTWGEQ